MVGGLSKTMNKKHEQKNIRHKPKKTSPILGMRVLINTNDYPKFGVTRTLQYQLSNGKWYDVKEVYYDVH